MRTSAVLLLMICIALPQVRNSTKSDEDPCAKKTSNFEFRECYAREQVTANSETDRLTDKIAGEYKRVAKGEDKETAELAARAASGLALSQITWKTYRDQYCNAVRDSWTSGSGAGIAYEYCLFQLGRARAKQLRDDFDVETKQK